MRQLSLEPLRNRIRALTFSFSHRHFRRVHLIGSLKLLVQDLRVLPRFDAPPTAKTGSEDSEYADDENNQVHCVVPSPVEGASAGTGLRFAFTSAHSPDATFATILPNIVPYNAVICPAPSGTFPLMTHCTMIHTPSANMMTIIMRHKLTRRVTGSRIMSSGSTVFEGSTANW